VTKAIEIYFCCIIKYLSKIYVRISNEEIVTFSTLMNCIEICKDLVIVDEFNKFSGCLLLKI